MDFDLLTQGGYFCKMSAPATFPVEEVDIFPHVRSIYFKVQTLTCCLRIWLGAVNGSSINFVTAQVSLGYSLVPWSGLCQLI